MLKLIGKIIAGGDKKPASVPWYPLHLEQLRDPREAAYYLFAALEDAIDERDLSHFFNAMHDVQSVGHADAIRLPLTHLPEEERKAFIERLNSYLFNAEEKLKRFEFA
ncbi:MAG TPA: hypothetical protein VK465_06930 [Fibrobacteria bacterium]|nr:hypothetical protein [Fibrobacteria bacterium]